MPHFHPTRLEAHSELLAANFALVGKERVVAFRTCVRVSFCEENDYCPPQVTQEKERSRLRVN